MNIQLVTTPKFVRFGALLPGAVYRNSDGRIRIKAKTFMVVAFGESAFHDAELQSRLTFDPVKGELLHTSLDELVEPVGNFEEIA